MTDDLIAFIRARLDEASQLADIMIEASWPPSVHVVPGESNDNDPQPSVSVEVIGGSKRYQRVWSPNGNTEDGWVVHKNAIEIWSAAEGQRRLRAVEAKRRILELVERSLPGACDCEAYGHHQDAEDVLGMMASEWADHTDYQTEWTV